MIIKEEMKLGLYGQILLCILEILPYLDENNIKPKWNITSPYYGNIFGKYINEKNSILLSNLYKNEVIK